MEFKNDFERREWIGRQALRELKRDNLNIFKYDIIYEPDPYSVYDASFINYDYESHSIRSRNFIEIKIRDRIFPDYVLEKKKVNSLHKKMNELGLSPLDYKLWYLNFCPEGTYLWEITDVWPTDCTDSRYMNVATANSRDNKELKYYKGMLPEQSKSFDYIIDPDSLIEEEKMRRQLPKIEKKIQQKGLNWLFED